MELWKKRKNLFRKSKGREEEEACMLISTEHRELNNKFQLFSGARVPSLKHPMGQKDLGSSSHKQGKAGPSNSPDCVAGPVSFLVHHGQC